MPVVQNARALSIVKVYWARVRRLVLSLAFVTWLSFAEQTILDRLLYTANASTAFVVESVRGVLAGTPVSKSWQHRFLGPLFVSALGGANLEAVERFAALTLLAANVTLLALLWRRAPSAVLAVVCLGLARFVLAYTLEYPWDGIDQILFVTFGAMAHDGKKLRAAAPLLVVGAFNHETILYVPLWYVLSSDRKERVAGAVVAALLGAVILAVRAVFYVGQPDLPGQIFEQALPVLGNHFHVAHNLRMLFLDDWRTGRAHIALGFFAAVTTLAWLAMRTSLRRAAVWTLIVIGTVVCFGYVNETRHYLVLAAFWIAYRWQ
jgi:hypothetical protein